MRNKNCQISIWNKDEFIELPGKKGLQSLDNKQFSLSSNWKD